MSEPASISTGIAARYAAAVFDLSQESNDLKGLESDVETLGQALADSDDLKNLISSPIYTRDQQQTAIAAIAGKMGLSGTTTSVLGLMASKRRLFVVPQLVDALRARIADEKGEIAADVTSAKALTKDQTAALTAALSKQVGKTVKITETVDESLIGGLVVKVGSKMIDTSIASKLNALQNSMKEVR